MGFASHATNIGSVQHQHVAPIRPESLVAFLPQDTKIDQALARASKPFSGTHTLPMYLARYGYGSTIVGPRSTADYFSTLLSPCRNSATCCNDCTALKRDTQDHRPLVVVLSGVVEEYLAFGQIEKLGRDHAVKQRNIPLRIAHPGEVFGAYEALNAFYFDDYGRRGNKIFGAPARRLASGARSIFINAPIKQVADSFKRHIPRPILSRYYRVNSLNISELGSELDADHSRLVTMLAEATRTDWKCELLIIPFETLRTLIWDNKSIRPAAHDLLLEIHRIGWMLSRHSRSSQIRNAAIADPLTRKGTNTYTEQTIQHLLSMGRGEVPGFAPFSQENEAGPFKEVLEFINTTDLANSFECFPSILQPAHLGRSKHQSNAVYYSFEHPTLLVPLRKLHSGPDFMQELKIRMNELRRKGRMAAKNPGWRFYISKGLPKPGRNFEIFAESEAGGADFEYQRTLAGNLEKMRHVPFFGPERDGFLSKFIRLHLETDPKK